MTKTELVQVVAGGCRAEWTRTRTWTCGLATITLIWLFRVYRYNAIAVKGKVGDIWHCWCQDDGYYYDPTIEQFGAYPTSGLLPHPLAEPASITQYNPEDLSFYRCATLIKE